MRNVKIIGTILAIILGICFINTQKVFASEETTYISLSDDNILVNNSNISHDMSGDVYFSESMKNGGSSEDASKANIAISNIVNIQNSGVYEFTGNLNDGQISINSNNINGDVVIVLNNVNISCENAPAIFVYNTATKSDVCNVIIKTSKDSTNTVSGGKIKQSVEGWSDQSQILYYVEKDYNDENKYFERYKYDGAISSDISLTLEGEGILTINSLAKEGIEVKRDLTINSGNYIINSLDDGINACADNESIITINDGNILVNVLSEADEGDGIDSNGYLYINGGSIFSFASEKSEDSGLDSDLGIYINGGNVVATGNMSDGVSDDSKQNFIQLQFNDKILKDTLITVTDNDKNPIIGFLSDRSYKVLVLSKAGINDKQYKVYEGGTIEGVSENGLYTEIISYNGGTEKQFNNISNMGNFKDMPKDMNNFNLNSNKIFYCIIIGLGVILVILVVIGIITKKMSKIFMFFVGCLVGAIIAITGLCIYNNINQKSPQIIMDDQIQERKELPNNKMQGEEMPKGQMPNENEI